MGSFVLKQALRCILLILAVSFVTFALISASPVDPLQANLGQGAYLSMTADERAQAFVTTGRRYVSLHKFLARAWAADLAAAIRHGKFAALSPRWLDGIALDDPVATSMVWANESNAFVCSNGAFLFLLFF